MIKHILSKVLLSMMLTSLFITTQASTNCTGVDLIITNITFTSISSSAYNYTYEIKNIGTSAVSLSEIGLQNYVSTNGQIAGAQAAGGSSIASTNMNTLAPNATYTGSMSAYPTCCGGGDNSTYPYLIVDISAYPTSECDATNNRMSLTIVMPTSTGTQSKAIANANVIWNSDTKNFTVNDWSGAKGAVLNYVVITPSGTQVTSGKTTENQSVPLQGLPGGVYILYLSDEMLMYSKKIAY
ncbi:MAG: hypothetical protein U0U66_04485 [Cytophagaceae bacterium]